MIMKMRDMMKRKNGQKGFTLVELIVVMAILAVLAAIAVPKYNGIQVTAKVKADGATAQSIARAARIQQLESASGAAVATVSTNYMDVPAKIQSGTGGFTLGGGGSAKYTVKFTPTLSPYDTEQTVTEGETWTPVEKS